MPERRCSPYDSDDYRYPQSVEDGIIRELGGVYGPYTGRWFASKSETDIEHMVARSEAHDSGLCAANAATRRRFATDPLNLTLAGPRVNRYQKSDRDAADWLPAQNRCWFAARVIAVRQRYGLTIDRREANALDAALSGCAGTDVIVFGRGDTPPAATPLAAGGSEVVAEWDDNRNGRISCAEARAHGIAPVTRKHPAYPFMRDGDGDGVVCESGGRSSVAASPSQGRGGAGSGCGPYRNCTALRRDHSQGGSARALRVTNAAWTATTMGEPVNASGPGNRVPNSCPKAGRPAGESPPVCASDDLRRQVLVRVAGAETAATTERTAVRRGPRTVRMVVWIPARKVVIDGGIMAGMMTVRRYL